MKKFILLLMLVCPVVLHGMKKSHSSGERLWTPEHRHEKSSKLTDSQALFVFLFSDMLKNTSTSSFLEDDPVFPPVIDTLLISLLRHFKKMLVAKIKMQNPNEKGDWNAVSKKTTFDVVLGCFNNFNNMVFPKPFKEALSYVVIHGRLPSNVARMVRKSV